MSKKLLFTYRIPLMISVTLFVVLLALRAEGDPLAIAQILLGTVGGAFILDLDYFLHAFFLEPESDFSKNVRGFTKHLDIPNALSYIHYHKDDIKEKTLNSGLFQMVLAALMIFVVSSTTSLLVKALVLSTFTNSLYKMAEYYFENKLDQWFWSIKISTSKQSFYIYSTVLVAALLFSLSLF